MPRSRGSEMPQRVSPRAPLQLKTSSSDSDSLHHRSMTDRSPKVGGRRSPRDAQSDPLNPKKLGTRVADLESQLGQAQDELKVLKDQLASAEVAKKEAQEKLEKKSQIPNSPKSSGLVEVQDEHPPNGVQESNKSDNVSQNDVFDENQRETDVFEVPMEKVNVESKVEFSPTIDEENHGTKPISVLTEYDELAMKNDEINLMKVNLEEKEKELEVFRLENESLKDQLNEASLEMSTCRAKEGEMSSKLNQLQQQLDASKGKEVTLKEKLQAVEGAKEALETEMKKLRVQTEQWRKAADAAAAVLSGGVDMNGMRMPERCGSMDIKHFGSVFQPSGGGYAGFVGSPSLGEDSDDGYGSGKRKGSGMRKFGDLWKKKGNK